MLLMLIGPVESVRASCRGVSTVGNDATLLASKISDFNGESSDSGACDFTIQLTANVLLPSTWTTVINNGDAADALTIDGNGFAIDGQGASGVRPITIDPNTTVNLEDIKITGGNISTAQGGGIYTDGDLTVMRSTISGNSINSSTSTQGGGIRVQNNGSLTLIDSTVSGNTASGSSAFGGRINGGNTVVTVSRSTVSGNVASGTSNAWGGGIFGYNVNLSQSTVSDNTTSASNASGSGIHNAGTVNLRNSLIANQATGSDCSGSAITSNGYNLDSDGTCLTVAVATATDISSGSVFLGPLADNGGPTQTHALLEPVAMRNTATPPPVNEAIDAIPVSVAAAAIESTDSTQAIQAICNGVEVTQDQRGFTSPVNGACDIGALESGASDPLAVSLGWFLAEMVDDTVAFAWQTAIETGVAGFQVLADTEGGPIALNDALIPSPAIDSVSPVDYSFSASTDATRFYLDEVGIDGATQRHGPFELGVLFGARSEDERGVEVTPALYLPFATN